MRVGLILAAGGEARRLGVRGGKQLLRIGGSPLFVRALAAFAPFRPIVGAVVVHAPGQGDRFARALVSSGAGDFPIDLVEGGTTRQESVHRGLARLDRTVTHCLVHDGARPLVPAEVIDRVLRALEGGARAVIPVLPSVDTLKEIFPDGRIRQTLDRERIFRAQTPQGFERSLLEKAMARALAENFSGTDESSLVERLKVEIQTVAGDISNLKVTFPADLEEARRLWRRRELSG